MPEILIGLLVHLVLMANIVVLNYDLLLVINADEALDRWRTTPRHNILIPHLEELKEILALMINLLQISLYTNFIKILAYACTGQTEGRK